MTAKRGAFHDAKYGVRLRCRRGGASAARTTEVSTFRLSTRGRRRSERRCARWLRSRFNPFPLSTFSGAWFYFSVQPHRTTGGLCGAGGASAEGAGEVEKIGGMDLWHGHDEHGEGLRGVAGRGVYGVSAGGDVLPVRPGGEQLLRRHERGPGHHAGRAGQRTEAAGWDSGVGGVRLEGR